MDSGESFCDLCTRLGLHDTPLIDIIEEIDRLRIEEIDRLRTFIAEKDAEIEHLREELDWKETGGVDRITGKAWLTTRMHLEAEILELRMKLEEKDREIEQLEAENDNMRKIFDMAILPPEYFVKEDGDDSTVEDFRQPSSGGD